MADMNAVIARYKGWREIDTDLTMFTWVLYHEERLICGEYHCPDYLNDARLYMALFEEMSSEFFSIMLMQHDYNNKTTVVGDYRQGHNENIPQFVVEADPIGTAICKAYCELHGLEYETSIAQALSELECEE